MSSPSWGRGLKSGYGGRIYKNRIVVPLVGTWIEILAGIQNIHASVVVPLVGTWIEIIQRTAHRGGGHTSSPSWGRGLKSLAVAGVGGRVAVVPLVGTWIEIFVRKFPGDPG